MGIWNIVYLVVDNYCIYKKKCFEVMKIRRTEMDICQLKILAFTWPFSFFSRRLNSSSPAFLFFSISFLFGFAFFPSRSHPPSSPSSPPSAPSSPPRSSSSSFKQKQKQQWRAAHSELDGLDFSASLGAKSGGIL